MSVVGSLTKHLLVLVYRQLDVCYLGNTEKFAIMFRICIFRSDNSRVLNQEVQIGVLWNNFGTCFDFFCNFQWKRKSPPKRQTLLVP